MKPEQEPQGQEFGPSFDEYMEARNASANRTDALESGILIPDESTKTKDEQYPHESGFIKEFGKGVFAGYPCSDIFLTKDNAHFEMPGIGRGGISKSIYEDRMGIDFDSTEPFSEDCENICDAATSFLNGKGFRHEVDYRTNASVDYLVTESAEGSSRTETGNNIQKDLTEMLAGKYDMAEIEREQGCTIMKKEGIYVELCDTDRHSPYNSVFFSAERGCSQELFHAMQDEVIDFLDEHYSDFIRTPHNKEPRTHFNIDVLYKAVEKATLIPLETAVFEYMAGNINKLGGLGIKDTEDLKEKIFTEGMMQSRASMMRPVSKHAYSDELSGRHFKDIIGEVFGWLRGSNSSHTAETLFGKVLHYTQQDTILEITLHGRDIIDYESFIQDPMIRREAGSEDALKKIIATNGIWPIFDLLCEFENMPPPEKFDS
ncbi:MAG: hypothetical protein R6U32_00650 [Candidatus Woesearchaeota archaeon]